MITIFLDRTSGEIIQEKMMQKFVKNTITHTIFFMKQKHFQTMYSLIKKFLWWRRGRFLRRCVTIERLVHGSILDFFHNIVSLFRNIVKGMFLNKRNIECVNTISMLLKKYIRRFAELLKILDITTNQLHTQVWYSEWELGWRK